MKENYKETTDTYRLTNIYTDEVVSTARLTASEVATMNYAYGLNGLSLRYFKS